MSSEDSQPSDLPPKSPNVDQVKLLSEAILDPRTPFEQIVDIGKFLREYAENNPPLRQSPEQEPIDLSTLSDAELQKKMLDKNTSIPDVLIIRDILLARQEDLPPDKD